MTAQSKPLSLHRHKWVDPYRHCIQRGCTCITWRKLWRDYKILWFMLPVALVVAVIYYSLVLPYVLLKEKGLL